MNTLVQKFRSLLGNKQYDQLEDVWLELLEAQVPLDELLELAELTERYAPEGQVVVLLSVLADLLKEKSRFEEQLRVLRRLVELCPEDRKLPAELADCFRQLYAGTELERLLQKSGLGYGRRLKPALANLDRFLALVPGSWLYHRERGPGKVERLDLLLDRVTLRFADRSDRTVSMGAIGRHSDSELRVIPKHGYFWQLENDRPALVELAAKKPVELVKLYLRDTGQPAGVKQLRQGLSDLVAPDAWDGFWNKARKNLEQDPYIIIRSKPSRTFQWSAEPVRKPKPDKKASRPKLASASDSEWSDNGVCYRMAELAGMTPEAVLDSYRTLTSFAQRRQFLEHLKTARPDDWLEIAARLFLVGQDRRTRNLLEKELSKKQPDLWHEVLEQVVTGYRQNPDAFLWMLANGHRLKLTDAKRLISRAVDLLESNSHRTYWSGVRSALADADYRLLRSGLEQMDERSTRNFLSRVNRTRSLEQFRKDDIAQLAAVRFPVLAKKEEHDTVLSTGPAIERARQELQKLLQEEVPKTAEEIGRARAHGDLSENYEYKAAKEKQARLMARINRLRTDLSRAEPIQPADVDTSQVSVGCRVRLEDESGQALEYTILGPWDSDPEHGRISYLAPFGQQLLGKKPGDSVETEGRLFTVKRISLGL